MNGVSIKLETNIIKNIFLIENEKNIRKNDMVDTCPLLQHGW
jgi:hypothetical protein